MQRTCTYCGFCNVPVPYVPSELIQRPLPSVPTGVFLAFCHWQTGAQPQPFQSLMNHVPNLDQQLLDHVQQALPMLSWDDWNAQAVRAVQDPAAGQQLAEHVMMESAFPGRRLLFC